MVFEKKEANMAKFFIPVIAGTIRPKRMSIHAARLVHEVASQLEEVESMLIDPVDFPLPYDGNDPECKNPKYTEITARADAFFVVTPEYNHSFPGTLKRLLDSELKNYLHKPIAFAGVSSTPWGGVRAIEALVTSVREMGLVPTFTDLRFPQVSQIFNEQGQLQDEKYRERIKRSYDELLWMTKTLKWGRENLPSK
jgi:NAD(P)H-dependent FMN reductase